MSNRQYFRAYVFINKGTEDEQLIQVIFEYDIIEYWGEQTEQRKLRDYFESNHFLKTRPVYVEDAGIFDFMRDTRGEKHND